MGFLLIKNFIQKLGIAVLYIDYLESCCISFGILKPVALLLLSSSWLPEDDSAR